MNIADTNKCTFCNDFGETISVTLNVPMYPFIVVLERRVDWLKEFKINLGIFNEFNVLFGLFNVNHFKLINHVVCTGRQMIYTCRANKIKPNLNIFFRQITKYTYDRTLHKGEKEWSFRILLFQMGQSCVLAANVNIL